MGEAEPSDLDWITALNDVSGQEYWNNVQTGVSTAAGTGTGAEAGTRTQSRESIMVG